MRSQPPAPNRHGTARCPSPSPRPSSLIAALLPATFAATLAWPGLTGCATVSQHSGAPSAAKPWRGSIATRGVYRHAGDDDDLDLTAYVEADYGEPDADLSHRGVRRNGAPVSAADEVAVEGSSGSGQGAAGGASSRWSARFAGRVHLDVDGNDGDLFDGLDDANDGSLVARVYDAYADWEPGDGALGRVRVGRQTDYETPVFVVFDGVRVESTPLGDADVVLGAFGGLSTHQYEASNDGDRLVGLWADGTPWQDARLRFDALHAEDERAIGSFDEDLFSLALRQRLSREWRMRAAYSHLGSDPRDLDVDATWASEDGKHFVRGTYYELFETQSVHPLEFDTFSETLFDWYPFRRGGLLGWTRLNDAWRLEAGYDLRDVQDDDDEGRFNRDVRRAHLTAFCEGVLGDGTTLSVTVDDWDSDAHDVRTFGATLSKALDEATDVSLGTYYAAYEIDSLLLTEREDVRTWYASFGRELSDALSLDTSYSFQDTEFEEFHTLKVTLRWRF